MSDDNGIMEAEQRVREMNRVTRQYSEQGNRFLRSMREPPQAGQPRQVRFEPAAPAPIQEKRGQDNTSAAGQRVRNRQNSPPSTAAKTANAAHPPENIPPAVPENKNRSNIHNSGPMMFPDLTADSEKLMLLLLMYLLIREKADIKLLLALGYLLL